MAASRAGPSAGDNLPPSLAADKRVKNFTPPEKEFNYLSVFLYLVRTSFADGIDPELRKKFNLLYRLLGYEYNGRPYGILISDYAERIYNDSRYPVISGHFIDAIHVDMDKYNAYMKLEQMMKEYFLESGSNIRLDSDRTMMFLLMIKDLINEALLAEDLNRAVELVNWLQRIIWRTYTQLIDFNNHMDEWLPIYDHIVDPQRRLNLLADDQIASRPSTAKPRPPKSRIGKLICKGDDAPQVNKQELPTVTTRTAKQKGKRKKPITIIGPVPRHRPILITPHPRPLPPAPACPPPPPSPISGVVGSQNRGEATSILRCDSSASHRDKKLQPKSASTSTHQIIQVTKLGGEVDYVSIPRFTSHGKAPIKQVSLLKEGVKGGLKLNKTCEDTKEAAKVGWTNKSEEICAQRLRISSMLVSLAKSAGLGLNMWHTSDHRVRKPDIDSELLTTKGIVHYFICSRLLTTPEGHDTMLKERLSPLDLAESRLGIVLEDYAKAIVHNQDFERLRAEFENYMKQTDESNTKVENFILDRIIPPQEPLFFDRLMAILLIVAKLVNENVLLGQVDAAINSASSVIEILTRDELREAILENGWIVMQGARDSLMLRAHFNLISTQGSAETDSDSKDTAADQHIPYLFYPNKATPTVPIIISSSTPGQSKVGNLDKSDEGRSGKVKGKQPMRKEHRKPPSRPLSSDDEAVDESAYIDSLICHGTISAEEVVSQQEILEQVKQPFIYPSMSPQSSEKEAALPQTTQMKAPEKPRKKLTKIKGLPEEGWHRYDQRVMQPDPAALTVIGVLHYFVKLRLPRAIKKKSVYKKFKEYFCPLNLENTRLGIVLEDFEQAVVNSPDYEKLLIRLESFMDPVIDGVEKFSQLIVGPILPDTNQVPFDRIMSAMLLASEMVNLNLEASQVDNAVLGLSVVQQAFTLKAAVYDYCWKYMQGARDALVNRNSFDLFDGQERNSEVASAVVNNAQQRIHTGNQEAGHQAGSSRSGRIAAQTTTHKKGRSPERVHVGTDPTVGSFTETESESAKTGPMKKKQRKTEDEQNVQVCEDNEAIEMGQLLDMLMFGTGENQPIDSGVTSMGLDPTIQQQPQPQTTSSETVSTGTRTQATENLTSEDASGQTAEDENDRFIHDLLHGFGTAEDNAEGFLDQLLSQEKEQILTDADGNVLMRLTDEDFNFDL